jgi:hypothetical protein
MNRTRAYLVKRIIKEPLLQFLLLGAGVFAVDGFLNGGEVIADPHTIVVERDKLHAYLQYRSKVFDTDQIDRYLAELTQDQLNAIVSEYVQEEALYREARYLQLDQADYVTRLRLIQQLEFITRGFMDATSGDISDEAITSYYNEHNETYRVAPRVTFTHVFFSLDKRGKEEARRAAVSTLERLNGEHIRFDQAPSLGDRFYYSVNYAKVEPDVIMSHFGEAMWQQINTLSPSDSRWYGPFDSLYGDHVVMLTHKEESYLPPLNEIHARVEADARRDLQERQYNQAIRDIVSAYKVKLDLDPLDKGGRDTD